jgi:hypothetical protein
VYDCSYACLGGAKKKKTKKRNTRMSHHTRVSGVKENKNKNHETRVQSVHVFRGAGVPGREVLVLVRVLVLVVVSKPTPGSHLQARRVGVGTGQRWMGAWCRSK